ncbi:MAG: cyclase [Bacteroidia bacterium]|nr:MAG: cyclase [Bacteroidia bacterium]
MGNLWKELEKLKSYRWVDLTHPLGNESPYWSGMPDGVLALAETVMPYEEMNFCIQTFKFPGQLGTHIDFPAHFARGGKLCRDYGVKDFALPLVVIDLSEKVKANADYEITLDDIHEFEQEHGRIPEGSFVAMRTDWHTRWPSREALINADADGNGHSPGWTMEALRFLYQERGIAANGHETFDTDAPITSHRVGDLQCERYVLDEGKFQLELMANLDQCPPVGAIILIGVIRVEEANGLPVRAFAVCGD